MTPRRARRTASPAPELPNARPAALVARVGLLPGLLVGLGLCAGCPSSSAGRTETAVATAALPIPATYFGMHIHRADQGTPWTGNGIGSWRLLDAGVSWFHLQPARDRWELAKLDRLVAMAEAAGVDLVLPLAFTPRWASARPDEKSAFGPGQASEPANLGDWQEYVRVVATRYRGRIRNYEIWNEPHSKSFFTGSPAALVALQNAAYEALRRVDPGITVVSAAISESHRPSLGWFERYIEAGGGDHIDVIAYHYYFPAGEPEEAFDLTRRLRAILRRNGVEKPIWNTESGWQIQNDDGSRWPGVSPSWPLVDARRAASYVIRALIITRFTGVDRFYWYAWDNYAMGLIEPATGKPKLAGRVYRALAERLAGGAITTCHWQAQRWECDLVTRHGQQVKALWTRDGEHVRVVPRPEWGTYLWRPVDESLEPVASSTPVDVTSEPIFLLHQLP